MLNSESLFHPLLAEKCQREEINIYICAFNFLIQLQQGGSPLFNSCQRHFLSHPAQISLTRILYCSCKSLFSSFKKESSLAYLLVIRAEPLPPSKIYQPPPISHHSPYTNTMTQIQQERQRVQTRGSSLPCGSISASGIKHKHIPFAFQSSQGRFCIFIMSVTHFCLAAFSFIVHTGCYHQALFTQKCTQSDFKLRVFFFFFL